MTWWTSVEAAMDNPDGDQSVYRIEYPSGEEIEYMEWDNKKSKSIIYGKPFVYPTYFVSSAT
jgi:hypothetical protein